MLVHVIKKVPIDLFDAASTQVLNYDTSLPLKNKYLEAFDLYKKEVPFTQEGINPIFLRYAYNETDNLKKPGEFANQNFIPMDQEILYTKFNHMIALLDWVKNTLKGINFGNIIINYMKPNGKVSLHVDRGIYFKEHSRFHIPFMTNSDASFDSGPDTKKEHMPLGHLCRLNNLLPHQAYNLGQMMRIHLIIDVLLQQENKIL